jgi:hypothetical protein
MGGSSYFYWFGTYTCSEGTWKGELSTQEHTPVRPQRVMASVIALHSAEKSSVSVSYDRVYFGSFLT